MAKKKNIIAALAGVAAGAAILNARRNNTKAPAQVQGLTGEKKAYETPFYYGFIDPNYLDFQAPIGAVYLDKTAGVFYTKNSYEGRTAWVIVELQKDLIQRLSLPGGGGTGPAGPTGATGPAGTSVKFLNGAGDPDNDLTENSTVSDYYLNNTTGNLWQRVVYTGSAGPTTLILAGNVQWEKVATLKGPAGVNGLQRIDENTKIELSQYITDDGNVKRMYFENGVTRLQGRIFAREDIEKDPADPELKGVSIGAADNGSLMQVIMKSGGQGSEIFTTSLDPDDEEIKDTIKLLFLIDEGYTLYETYALTPNGFEKVHEYSGAYQMHRFNGKGVVFPSMNTIQMNAIEAGTVPGTVAYNSITNKLRVRTNLGWTDLH